MGIPTGLLLLEDIEERGGVKETRFIWLKQRQKTEHKFEKIGKVAQYAKELMAFVEPKKIKKITGLKTKELFMWFSVSEAIVDDTTAGKITFKTATGLLKVFPSRLSWTCKNSILGREKMVAVIDLKGLNKFHVIHGCKTLESIR